MTREKLEKFIPLGLLALAIVAGVVGIVARSVSDDLKDAGFDVIGYFACESEHSRSIEMVLINEGDTFQALMYLEHDDQIIQKGKPTDLSFLSRRRIENQEVDLDRYRWVDKNYGTTYNLDRGNGVFRSKTPRQEANLPGCSGSGCLGQLPTYGKWDCKYGKEGKKLFWEATVNDYERHAPKF